VKYAFIKRYKTQFPILKLCRVLRVSRSGFYDWRGRSESKRSIRHSHLANEIRRVHDQSNQTYGAVKCWKALRRDGFMFGRDQIVKIRRKNGIYSKRRRRFVITTKSKLGHKAAPNILNREFSAIAPNKAWVGDVTFIPTRKGWLYLSVLLDFYSRKVVGWSMGNRNDSSLVKKCLEMAIEHRRPPLGLVHHTDRGSTYTAEKYRSVLSDHGMISSMSRKGNCWERAACPRGIMRYRKASSAISKTNSLTLTARESEAKAVSRR